VVASYKFNGLQNSVVGDSMISSTVKVVVNNGARAAALAPFLVCRGDIACSN